MALTNKQKQEAMRFRRAELGQKRREYYLTDAEKLKIDDCISRMRKGTRYRENTTHTGNEGV